tara:strand:+ start:42 stop:1022 length:981 start_codon:yes stop_codon:yes gene_type:complete
MSTIIQAIPIKDTILTTMESTISDVDDQSIQGYIPNGTYTIKTSSYFGDNTQGFNAFNDDTGTYWESDNVGNNNTESKPDSNYTQSPYSGIIPSSYLGGGSDNNTFSTKVGPNKYKTEIPGEWIEIKIPYKIYLTSFSITTPTFSATNSFPKKFTLVSSNDGNSWDYVDQYLINNDDMPSQKSPTKTFSVTSYNKFSYFRLIITQMGDEMSILRINKLQIKGTPQLSSVPETFSTLHRSIDGFTNQYNKQNGYGLEGADLYRPTYSNYTDTTLEIENPKIKEQNAKDTKTTFFNNITDTVSDVLLYTGILTGAVVTGLLLTNMSKR